MSQDPGASDARELANSVQGMTEILYYQSVRMATQGIFERLKIRPHIIYCPRELLRLFPISAIQPPI